MKRIVCVLLTLIMLLSLVPMGASAASHKISDAAITVLKQMTTFKGTCYHHSGEEFRTGYGTVCEKDHHFDKNGNPDDTKLNADGTVANVHTISKYNADLALRKALTSLDKTVCAFETSAGLSLSQNQHDALVVFSYNAGTGWISGSGVIRSVIMNKGSAEELLNAMNLWTKNADRSRREVEVNMYINGIYSNTAPSHYTKAIYNPNGGSMPQSDYDGTGNYTYYFDLNRDVKHPVIPTQTGYKFLGWYLDNSGELAWTPELNKFCDGNTLYAQWQSGNTPVDVNYQLHQNHLASKGVYDTVTSEKGNATLAKKLAESLVKNNSLVWVDQDMIDSRGIRWSHLRDIGGWVMVGSGISADNSSTTDSFGTVIATATVTANGYLNLRKEAGTDYPIIGALAKNDTVNIYEIKTVNGHQWGKSKSGWLCLTYTRLILKDDVVISDKGAQLYGFTGKTGAAELQVHVEPGTDTNIAQYTVPNTTDPKGDSFKDYLAIPANTAVTLTNLFILDNGTPDGEYWVKATWQNPEWKWKSTKASDGKVDIKITRSGWIKKSDVTMDPAKFTVAAESVNVREGCGDQYPLVFTLNKGVQVVVSEIKLFNENIWGRISVKKTEHVDASNAKDGWVNLASKYFTRDGAPSIEEEENNTLENLVATVINTDSLKVRKYGATYGQQIGTLSRGTTVAVWEYSDSGWYKVDSNKNGVYDYKEDGWCSEKYLDVHKDSSNTSSTVTDAAGNKYQTDGTGKGIVANTYSGLNVRTGPSTAHAAVGKLLPGTIVDILETANNRKWGRTSQGWVSMDYIAMVSYNEVIPDTTPEGGITVESYDKADKTSTTAVYTGMIASGTVIYRTPTKDEKKAEEIRTTASIENVTLYELATVTEVIKADDEVDGNVTTSTTITRTSYWGRINDGWIENPDVCLELNALDEKIHTLTGAESAKVLASYGSGNLVDKLVQGDQVAVTALKIIEKNQVWGRIETTEGSGWINLADMSEGKIYVKPPVQNNVTVPSAPTLGNTSSTGGFVTNTSGYRYTGKVIRANEVNVRATPSTAAAKTTTLKNGQALVVYETTIAENMAWGRCDAGWIYLYYVDLTPAIAGAVDARVVYNDNTVIYSDVNCSAVAGSYARMSTIDIYEIVGKMARTDLGWVNTDNLL